MCYSVLPSPSHFTFRKCFLTSHPDRNQMSSQFSIIKWITWFLKFSLFVVVVVFCIVHFLGDFSRNYMHSCTSLSESVVVVALLSRFEDQSSEGNREYVPHLKASPLSWSLFSLGIEATHHCLIPWLGTQPSLGASYNRALLLWMYVV